MTVFTLNCCSNSHKGWGDYRASTSSLMTVASIAAAHFLGIWMFINVLTARNLNLMNISDDEIHSNICLSLIMSKTCIATHLFHRRCLTGWALHIAQLPLRMSSAGHTTRAFCRSRSSSMVLPVPIDISVTPGMLCLVSWWTVSKYSAECMVDLPLVGWSLLSISTYPPLNVYTWITSSQSWLSQVQKPLKTSTHSFATNQQVQAAC